MLYLDDYVCLYSTSYETPIIDGAYSNRPNGSKDTVPSLSYDSFCYYIEFIISAVDEKTATF